MSLSEPPLGGLEPTKIRQGGPPARAVIGVFAIGLVAVIGIGVFGRSPAPTQPVPTALASTAAVAPSNSTRPATPTPAPTFRLGGCQTGLAPIAGAIPRHPRPLQPPPLVSIAPGGGTPYQVVASGGAFWTNSPGRLTRSDRTGATTGEWDYLDDPAFGSYMISPALGGGVWLSGPGGIQWFDGEAFADTIPSPTPFGDLSGITELPDGSVWATSYQSAPQRWDGVSWNALCDDHGSTGDGSSRLAVSPDRTIWFTSGADLVHVDSTGSTLGSVALPGSDRAGPEAVTVAADGSVWVGTQAAVQRFDGRWTSVPGTSGHPIGAVSLTAADDGSVWAVVGTGDGNCCSDVARFDGTDTRVFASVDGLGEANQGIGIGAVAVLGADVVATTGIGTYRIPAAGSGSGAWSAFGPAPTGLPDPTSISLLVVEGTDRVLAAAWDRLWEVRGGKWNSVDLPGLPPGSGSLDGLARSADGAVAVATSGGAMVRTDGRWEVLEPKGTMAIAFDDAGACWLAPGGSDPNTGDPIAEHALYRFTMRGSRWVRSAVAVPDDVASIESLLVGPDGDVWLRGRNTATVASLWRRHGKRWSVLPALPGADASWTGRRMAVTSDGDLVVAAGGSGTDQSLLAYRFDGKAWSSIEASGGAASFGSNDVATAADGTTWVTAWNSGLTATGGPAGDLRLPGAFIGIGLDAHGTAYVAGPSGIYRVQR